MTVFTSRQKCARSVCHFCFGALFPSKLFSVIHSNESRCFFLCLCLSLPVLRPIDASFQRFMIYEGNVSSLSFSSQSLFQKKTVLFSILETTLDISSLPYTSLLLHGEQKHVEGYQPFSQLPPQSLNLLLGLCRNNLPSSFFCDSLPNVNTLLVVVLTDCGDCEYIISE